MLSRSLYRKEIQENTIKFLLGVLLLGVLAIVTALSISASQPPEETLPGIATGELAEKLQLSLTARLWDQWNVKGLTLIGTLVTIILGAGVFAQEKAKGTLFFLTSMPLSRRDIYDTKLAAGLTLLGACLMVTTLILIFSASFAGLSLPALPFLAGAFSAFGILAVLYQVTIICSILTNDAIKAGATSILLCFLLSIPGWFEGGKNFSLLYQMQSRDCVLEEPSPGSFSPYGSTVFSPAPPWTLDLVP